MKEPHPSLDDHGALFLRPPRIDEWVRAARSRQERAAGASFLGLSVAETREELGIPSGFPVLMSGHQPVLLHPGLYAKLAAVSAAALRIEGRVLHKITDTDVPAEWSFRFPGASRPEGENPFFPPGSLEIPYSDQPAPSPERWKAVLDRCASGVPLAARDGWKDLFEGKSVSDAPDWNRLHWGTVEMLDRRMGLSRVPILASGIFGKQAFLRYAASWLGDIENLGGHLNNALAKYRRNHDLRNEAQPVPDLRMDGEWRETPFWLSETGRPRAALWTRKTGPKRALVRAGETGTVREASWTDGVLRVDGNVRVWPKALPQTLFTRMFLCDLFVHGTGGGLYEQVNDLFLASAFGETPPLYGVVSATLLLEPDRMGPIEEDLRRGEEVLRWKRILAQNPEYAVTRSDRWGRDLSPGMADRVRLLASSPGFRELVEEKGRLLQELADPSKRREAGLRIKQVNEGLVERIAPLDDGFRSAALERKALEERREALGWREHPFFCHPPGVLADLVERIRKS